MKQDFKVYMHKNKKTGEVYIGITCRELHDRWRHNGTGYRNQPKFYKAIQLYGWDNFEHLLLFSNLDHPTACSIEKELINKYDSINHGYNVDPGGSIHSDEIRKKMSIAMQGKKHTQETKDKISKAKDWVKKAVVCLETGKEYKSIVLASQDTDIDQSSIVRACKGKQVKAGNLHWRYKEDEKIYIKDRRKKAVICLDTKKVYESTAEAARDTNSDMSNIRKCCTGKYKSTNGLHWMDYEKYIQLQDERKSVE